MEVRPGYKQTEVGVIPLDWEVRTLNEVSIISRLAGAEYTSLWKETPNGEIIALRGFNIGQGKIIERDLVRISNKLSLKLKRSRLCKGDVVYPCVGSIGNAAVIDEDDKYHIQQNIARITPDHKAISSCYLANYLMSFLAAREVDRATSSSSQPSVLVGSLRQYRLPLPPIKAEQEIIAEVLSDVDTLLTKLDQFITKKRDLKQATMQELFRPKDGWRSEILENIADVIDPHPSHRAPPEVSNGIPFVGIGDINEDGEIIGTRLRTVATSVFEEHRARYKLEEGLIGLGRVASIGKVVKLQAAGVMFAVSPTLGVIRGTKVHRDYLLHVLKSRFVTDQFARIMSGSTRSSVGMVVLRRLDVLLPRHETEQTAIATVLSDMDAEITVLEARRDKTRALKQGMMQELLTGRIRLV